MTNTPKDRVFAAANDLTARGEKITTDTVREQAACSMTAAVKHLRDWRDQRNSAAQATLPEDIHAEFLAVWSRAESQAAAKHADERAAWEADRADLAQQLEDTAAAHDRLAASINDREARLHQAQADLTTEQQRSADLAEECSTLRTENAALHSKNTLMRKDIEQRIKNAADDARHEQKQQQLIDELRETANTAREEAARLQGENDGLKRALDALKKA